MTMLYEIEFLAQGKFRKLAEKSNLREQGWGVLLTCTKNIFFSFLGLNLNILN